MANLRMPNNLHECGLPVALEVMGERWAFMILRAAFNGVIHFEEFLQVLGIARNILSNRLVKLVEAGIMQRENCPNDRRKVEYRLTEKGVDLLPAMIALRQWGEKHGLGVASNPVLVDTCDNRPIGRIEIRAHDGRPLGWPELTWLDRSECDAQSECGGRRVEFTSPQSGAPQDASSQNGG